MGIFDRFKKKKVQHSYFGVLELSGTGDWYGKISFEDDSVGVTLPGDETGPMSFSEDVFHAFVTAYPNLRDEIAAGLFRLFQEHAKDFVDDSEAHLPTISRMHDVWSHFSLISISIEPDRTVQLTYCFTEILDDTLFSATVVNGNIQCEIIGD